MRNEGSNATCKLNQLGVPGFGVIGGMEKSSESDSAGVSDVNKSISVTGAPSICDTTQMQTKKIRTTEILSLGNE